MELYCTNSCSANKFSYYISIPLANKLEIMISNKTIQLFIKIGFLPLAKDKDDQPKVNLSNKMYLLINLFRILPLTVYLYLSISDLLSEDLNMKSVISSSFKAVGYIGGSGLAVILAITGQRLGPDALMGISEPCCWKNFILIGIVMSLYVLGNLMMEVPLILKQSTLVELLSFSFALISITLFVILDYGVLMVTSFLWVKDLKTKLNILIHATIVSAEKFEEILLDFERLRHSMKILTTFFFPFTQALAITSSYLGFVAG